MTKESLSKKVIDQVGGAQIRVPANFNLSTSDNEKFFVRVSALRRDTSLTFFSLVHHATTCFS